MCSRADWNIVSPFVLFVLAMSISSVLAGQDTAEKSHSISIKTQFLQIKEAFNYGLVYSGINLAGQYDFEKISGKNVFAYEVEMGFGGIFNKGAGFAWEFKPIDFSYGYRTKSKHLIAGAYLSGNYQWQQYSELQGGRLFWFSSIELGPQLTFSIPFKSKLIKSTISNSLTGFTSRPKPGVEAYYYSFGLSEFISSVHRDLAFASFNKFNHSNFEIELQGKPKKRFSIAYEFDYFAYYKDPKLRSLNHSINLKLKIGRI